MYNQQIINSRLARIQKSLKFQLTEHSVAQIQKNVDAINNLIDYDKYERTLLDKGKTVIEFKSPSARAEFFSDNVQNFIENETILSKWNCWYWMERYYKISDITNTFVQYAPNDAQKVWMRIHSRLEGLKRAIRTLDLKARQVGCTTFSQGVVEHRLQFFIDVKSMIASKDETSTGKMADMFMDSLNKQPFWLRPQLRNYERGSEYKFDNGSGLFLGWGTQKSLAKGTTCTVAHLSEIALFKYFTEAIENALIRAMHETIWLLQKFEGTAERRDDKYHNYVKETIKGMERGTSSMYFSFIPYFVRSDIYPPPAYISGRSDAYANFIPSTETLIHAKKAENWVKSNPDMRDVLGSNYQMSKETMFWYETEKKAAIAKDELATFLSQVPADWEEAFQHVGRTIYPIELITSYSNKAQEIIPEVYKLDGDRNEISPDLLPSSDEILDGGRKIDVVSNYGSKRHSFQLVQIKFEGWDKFNANNKILIWNHPSYRFSYGTAVDTSDGLGYKLSDNAVIEVIRKGTPEHRDRQDCEFVSTDLPQKIMWPPLLAICAYFSPKAQLELAIECNKGYELQNAMIDRGWWNLYKDFDEGRTNQDLSKVHKYGFMTNGLTRGQLIDNFSAFFKGEWIQIYSPLLIGEIKDLQKIRTISSTNKIMRDRIEGGLSGDDRFMATGICLYMLHRMEMMGHEKKSWEARAREEVKIDLQGFPGYAFEDPMNVNPEGFDDMLVRSREHFDEFANRMNKNDFNW